jgi:hypothetical protein
MADLHGWVLSPDDFLDENVDNGRVRRKSGGAELIDRPKLAQAVEAIEVGQARILAAENFDRLFRNLDVQRAVVRRVENAGGEVWERAGRISMRKAADKFNATIKGASSEYVKDTAEERSWDAVELAIEQGKVPWSQTAPGYTRSQESKLHPDLEMVPIIRAAFEMRRDDGRIADVRAFLARHGINRSYHGTQHLLRDRIYLGQIHFGKHTPNLSAHEPIIDPSLFEDVQARKDPRGRRSKSDRLLARVGVLVCSGCGGRMIAGTQKQNGRRYPFYRCGRVREDCDHRQAISAKLTEEKVVATMKDWLADLRGKASADVDLTEAESELTQAQEILDRAFKAFSGFESEEAARQRLLDLKEARDRARNRYEELSRKRERRMFAITVADWDQLTLADQRKLIQAALDRVVVRPGRGDDRIVIVPAFEAAVL